MKVEVVEKDKGCVVLQGGEWDRVVRGVVVLVEMGMGLETELGGVLMTVGEERLRVTKQRRSRFQ